MALLDTDRELIVVRIVYDGPALSGKTTTLRALAGSLGRDTFSGEEAEGRTLYFDWLDYTGGRFEGYPIRCQVVTVPGQRLLRGRRLRLLGEADAVVFVADSRRPNLAANARMLDSLRQFLGESGEPRPGVVVQANRRDDPDAATMNELRAALGAGGASAVTESVASAGTGLRETFVMAVRLALDRVRELMRRSALPEGRPDVDSAMALLETLREAEQRSTSEAPARTTPAVAAGVLLAASESGQGKMSPTAKPPARRRDSNGRALPPSAPPRLPSTDVPGGMIWPPVEGRIVLHEAVADDPPVARETDGGWGAVAGARWRLHSYAADVFREPEAARSTLVEWARWHSSGEGRLSQRRCILAATAGDETWRLWQVVRGEKTLRIALHQVLSRSEPDQVARGLLEQSRALAEGLRVCAARGMTCSVDTVGFDESGLAYVGLVPPVGETAASTTISHPPFEEQLRALFGPVVAQSLATSTLDVPRVLHHLTPLAAAAGQSRVAEILATILIGH